MHAFDLADVIAEANENPNPEAKYQRDNRTGLQRAAPERMALGYDPATCASPQGC